MALYHFHRVLISVAIIFDFIFTLWCIRRWNATGEQINAVMAVGSSAVTIMLLGYLVYFNKNLNTLRDDMLRRANAKRDESLSH